MLHRLVPTTPATRRGGELFLALAVFAVIVQLPGNVIVSLVLPPIALLISTASSSDIAIMLPVVAIPAFSRICLLSCSIR